MGKNIGCRKLLLQTLCCLVGIRGKRRDVDKRCNSRVGAGRRDDRATIGMTGPDGSKQLTLIFLHGTEYDLSTEQSGARAAANAPNAQQ